MSTDLLTGWGYLPPHAQMAPVTRVGGHRPSLTLAKRVKVYGEKGTMSRSECAAINNIGGSTVDKIWREPLPTKEASRK